MSPDEVLSDLKKLGIEMTRRSLARYEVWGLIPNAIRGGLGRGRGPTSDYPEQTVREAYAAWRLMNEFKHCKVDHIQKIRGSFLKTLEVDSFLKNIIYMDTHLWVALMMLSNMNVPAKTGFMLKIRYYKDGLEIEGPVVLTRNKPTGGIAHGSVMVSYCLLENPNSIKLEAEAWNDSRKEWIKIYEIIDDKILYDKCYDKVITNPEIIQ